MATPELRMDVGANAPLTDDEVVRRVIGGETALFEILMRRHNPRLYRALRGILRDEAEIEDVMQQAYVNAYVHLSQYASRAKFSTWLTRIAVHEALARIRKRSLHPVFSDSPLTEDETMNDPRATTPDPEQQAMTSDMRKVLENVVGSLSETYRSVLLLREVEGLSTAETAEILDTSEDVIKTRLSRARAMIRERLVQKAGVTYNSLFVFEAPRCNRIVAAVFARLGATGELR
jgi:RNA polymerase sigma-70 factor, ECF subfamily